MASPEDEYDKWSNQFLVLDMAGLSDAERREGSILLGGSAARFVTPQDDFKLQEVSDLVFSWGDPKVENMISQLQEFDTRPRLLEDQLIPFSAATVIGDWIHRLAIQPGTFDPAMAYQSKDHFIEIPYHPVDGYNTLRNAFETGHFPLPQLIGRVGIAWFLFESGIHLDSRETIQLAPPPIEEKKEMPTNEAFRDVEALIERHDFEQSSAEENNAFATQLSHWLLETFALPDNDGQYFMYTNDDGAEGEALPIALRQLLIKEYLGDTSYSDNNTFTIATVHDIIKVHNGEKPPETQSMTMAELVSYFTEHPEAMVAARPLYAYTPRVKLTVIPAEYHGWNMQYLISRAGIEVRAVESNDRGISLDAAYRYAKTAEDNQAELAKTVCELALLAAKYAPQFISGKIPASQVDELHERLATDAPVPLIKGIEYSDYDDEYFIESPGHPHTEND